MRDQGLGSTVTDVEPLTGGTQNIVVRLRVDGRPMVLRRPPLHPRPTSDKTMLREIAALRTLAGTPVPHPGFIAGCDDLDVLGVVFYLMEEVDGFNPGDSMDEAYVRNDDHGGITSGCRTRPAWPNSAMWSGKAARSRSSSGRDRFWSARFRSFCGCSKAIGTNEYEPESLAVTELAEWLESNRPPDGKPGIMHGDPHLSNVLLRRDKPELAAFVDWEMCTVGDPLLDLGWMLICWPLETNTITAGAELAALGGLATRRELLDAYLAAGGRETSRLDWYVAMACFKLGIVIEGTWSRFLVGQASRDAGERLHANAQNLIDVGTRVAKGDNPFE